MAVQKDPTGKTAPSGGFKELGWYSGYQYYQGSFAPAAGAIHPSSPQAGAGKAVSPEVLRQTSVAAGLEPGAHKAYTDTEQLPTTQEEVTPFLNQFQGEIYKAQGEPEVRSAEEIAKEVKGFLPAGEAPKPPSLLETYQTMREERGIDALEASIGDIKAQIEDEFAILREQRGIEEGKPVPMGVISGRISEEERTAQQRIDFLGRQQTRIVDEYTAAMGAIQIVMDLTGQDYQLSKEAYDTSFSQALNLYNVVQGVRESEKTDLQRYQDNARANLQVMANAITSGNLDLANAPVEYKMQIAKMEAASGLPVGFTASLGMSAQDQYLTYNEKTGEALMMRGDGSFEVIQTGMRPSPTGDTKLSETERKRVAFTEVENKLKELGGEDLYVSPEEWKWIRNAWLTQGYTAEEFDAAFRDRFVNPDWSASDFGLE